MAVSWNYYDKFETLNGKYLPVKGEGETKATQIVTSVNKLIYKWYNDGDVFDTTHHLKGWANDLSDFANWLDKHTDVSDILEKIYDCETESEYEDLLQELADKLLDENYLEEQNKLKKVDIIYDCVGEYKFVEQEDEDEEDYYDYDDEEEDDEDE